MVPQTFCIVGVFNIICSGLYTESDILESFSMLKYPFCIPVQCCVKNTTFLGHAVAFQSSMRGSTFGPILLKHFIHNSKHFFFISGQRRCTITLSYKRAVHIHLRGLHQPSRLFLFNLHQYDEIFSQPFNPFQHLKEYIIPLQQQTVWSFSLKKTNNNTGSLY